MRNAFTRPSYKFLVDNVARSGLYFYPWTDSRRKLSFFFFVSAVTDIEHEKMSAVGRKFRFTDGDPEKPSLFIRSCDLP